MSALGETLRTAREAQGLTLTDIADRIHIRSVYLAAIEAEDWAAIGPPVYARGFVRSYARALGLDPDAAVASYTAIGPASLPVLATSPRNEPAAPGRARAQTRPPGPSVWALCGIAVALLLVIVVGYEYVDFRRHATAVETSVTTPVAPADAPRASAPPEPARRVAAIPAIKAEEKASGFTLRLRDSSWLRVVLDGRVALEGVFPKGTHRTFTGRSATIRAGNAGGVEISVDGKNLGRMGGLGDVAERSFQL